MYVTEELQAKWGPVLDHEDLPGIKDLHKRNVTATVLENTERALREAGNIAGGQFLTEAPVNVAGNMSNFDPVLISLVRRSMPNLMAYDVCGVQPMTGPTGLIFAMRAKYANSTQLNDETFYNEVNTAFTTVKGGGAQLGNAHTGTAVGGTNGNTVNLPGNGYNFAEGMSTSVS